MATNHDTSHIVPVPAWVFWMKIVQVALAVFVLAFVAYPTNLVGGYSSLCLTLFTCCFTFITVGYYLVSTLATPQIYNRWAVLALEVLAIIFWLCSFALLADAAANAFIYTTSSYSYYSGWTWYKKRDLETRDLADNIIAARDLVAVSAALGGVQFVLFIVTLVYFSIGLHRHRLDGFHSPYGAQRSAPINQEAKQPNGAELPSQQQYQHQQHPAPVYHPQGAQTQPQGAQNPHYSGQEYYPPTAAGQGPNQA